MGVNRCHAYLNVVGRNRISPGRSYKFEKRGPVIRADDPNFIYDINRRPKQERIQASPDGYLRPTKERQKSIDEQFQSNDKSEQATS